MIYYSGTFLNRVRTQIDRGFVLRPGLVVASTNRALFFVEKVYPPILERTTLDAVELKLRSAGKKQHFPLKIQGFLYKSEDKSTKTQKLLEF